MVRDLPVYIIAGRRFIVDILKGELRDEVKTDNKLPIAEMTYSNEGYSFNFNTKTGTIARIGEFGDHVVKTEIPMLVVLDPVGMAEKHNVTIDSLKDKKDFELLIDQDLLIKRLSGLLPVVEIAGHDFIVDYRLNELRPKDDFNASIRIDELSYDYTVDRYIAFYQSSTHSIAEIDYGSIKSIPKDLFQIEVPRMSVLDPVAAAKAQGGDMLTMIMNAPLQEKRKIESIPAEKTFLAQVVKQNRNGHTQTFRKGRGRSV